VGEVEHDLFGLFDEFGDFAGAFVAEPCDVAACFDERPELCVVADDAGVVGGVRRGRNDVLEFVDTVGAAGVLEVLCFGEPFDNRDGVGGPFEDFELEDRLEDPAVDW
jgi:hypothetical protein